MHFQREGDGQPLVLFKKSIMIVIAALFKGMPGGSRLYPVKKTSWQGQRLYDGLGTGDWWNDAQSKVPAGAVIIPVIFYSDGTDLDTIRAESARPVVVTIGNLQPEVQRRRGGHQLLAFFPKVKEDEETGMSGTALKRRRRELTQEVLRDLMEPLRIPKERSVLQKFDYELSSESTISEIL